MDVKPFATAALLFLSACSQVLEGKDFAAVDAKTAAALSVKADRLAAEVTAATDGKPAAADPAAPVEAAAENAAKPVASDIPAGAKAGGETPPAPTGTPDAAAKPAPASGGLLAMFRTHPPQIAATAAAAEAAPAGDDPPDEFDEAAAAGEEEADPAKIAVPREPIDDGLAHDFVNVYNARPERQKDLYEGLPGVTWQGGIVLASRGPLDGDPRGLFGGERQPFGDYVPGMPREVVQAANGLLLAHAAINVSCVKPDLLQLVHGAERHFGRQAVITSGYRSPAHNRRVRGALHSQHLYCNALDLYMPGVARDQLARYFYDEPSRGGLGLYCHTKSIHIDTGRRREWRWSCRRAW